MLLDGRRASTAVRSIRAGAGHGSLIGGLVGCGYRPVPARGRCRSCVGALAPGRLRAVARSSRRITHGTSSQASGAVARLPLPGGQHSAPGRKPAAALRTSGGIQEHRQGSRRSAQAPRLRTGPAVAAAVADYLEARQRGQSVPATCCAASDATGAQRAGAAGPGGNEDQPV